MAKASSKAPVCSKLLLFATYAVYDAPRVVRVPIKTNKHQQLHFISFPLPLTEGQPSRPALLHSMHLQGARKGAALRTTGVKQDLKTILHRRASPAVPTSRGAASLFRGTIAAPMQAPSRRHLASPLRAGGIIDYSKYDLEDVLPANYDQDTPMAGGNRR